MTNVKKNISNFLGMKEKLDAKLEIELVPKGKAWLMKECKINMNYTLDPGEAAHQMLKEFLDKVAEEEYEMVCWE